MHFSGARLGGITGPISGDRGGHRLGSSAAVVSKLPPKHRLASSDSCPRKSSQCWAFRRINLTLAASRGAQAVQLYLEIAPKDRGYHGFAWADVIKWTVKVRLPLNGAGLSSVIWIYVWFGGLYVHGGTSPPTSLKALNGQTNMPLDKSNKPCNL